MNSRSERVEEAVTRVEEYLFANQEHFEIESVYSYYQGGFAQSSIYLKEDDYHRNADDIKEEIREGLPKLAIAEPSFDHRGGMGGAEAVSISLEGESSEVLYQLSLEVERVLGEISGFKDVKSEAERGGEEIHVVVDRLRASQAGVSSELIAGAVSAAMRGQNLRRLKGEDGEIDVRLALQDSDRKSLESPQEPAVAE